MAKALSGQWIQGQVEGLYGVSALAWPPHGGRLAVGTLAGGVALADAFLARSRHAGDLRITRVSRSLALAQRLSDGARGAAAQALHAGVACTCVVAAALMSVMAKPVAWSSVMACSCMGLHMRGVVASTASVASCGTY